MLSFLADENFRGTLLRGLRLHRPDIDIVSVQDLGLMEADDPSLLDWAARHGRILLTHDVKTVTKFAYERVIAGLPMPGVLEVNDSMTTRQALEEIALFCDGSFEGEYEGQVKYLPLK